MVTQEINPEQSLCPSATAARAAHALLDALVFLTCSVPLCPHSVPCVPPQEPSQRGLHHPDSRHRAERGSFTLTGMPAVHRSTPSRVHPPKWGAPGDCFEAALGVIHPLINTGPSLQLLAHLQPECCRWAVSHPTHDVQKRSPLPARSFAMAGWKAQHCRTPGCHSQPALLPFLLTPAHVFA